MVNYRVETHNYSSLQLYSNHKTLVDIMVILHLSAKESPEGTASYVGLSIFGPHPVLKEKRK